MMARHNPGQRAAHHPGDDTLIAYAAGTLGAGPSLVVTVHLETCAACCGMVATLEAVGGALMDELAPAGLSSLALARAMAAIERPIPMPEPATRPVPPGAAHGLKLPAALHGKRIGRWHWLAPGMRWSRVELAGDRQANVLLLRGRAEALLPAHGHIGSEFTQVLSGALLDGATRFATGDMFVADEAVNHHLQVASGAECVCLTAIEGRMRMNGLLGRLVQPLVGP